LKPNPKRTKAVLSTLVNHYDYLAGSGTDKKKQGKGGGTTSEIPGEYASLLEQEEWPFVLIEQFLVAV
jgi:V-type H+-transporting ATPase subunit C